MNLSFLDEDLEERKDIIIALLVIIFFGSLAYTMNWFSTEPAVAEPSVVTSPQPLDEDK